MSASQHASETVEFEVENVGGVEQTQISIPPGVTVLTGKNATNRTSFLQAIMAAMGSRQATLKGDADEGRVQFELGDETYERTLIRAGDTVSFNGEGYLDDPAVADLFAFLLETNEARQAVARGDNLREIIMRPVDIEEVKERIHTLESEKADINDELATIESKKTKISKLEQRKTRIHNQIEGKKDDLAEVEEQVDNNSRDIEESRSEQDALEAKLDELRSTRSDLESTRRQIDTQQQSISSLKQERSELKDELEELPETPMGDQQNLESEIELLRDKRKTINREISDLKSLIQYNEERLEEDDDDVLQTLGDAESTGSTTDELLTNGETSVICWTCGSDVERSQIEDTVSRLQDLRQEKVQTLDEMKSELDDLKAQQREAKQQQSRREQVERKLEAIDDELDQRETQIESLKDRRDDLTQDVEALEAEVDELESDDFDEILSLHKEANQLEFEIDSLETDLEEVAEAIEEIEAMLDRADELRAQRDDLLEQLTDERTKIDQIEANAVDAFNEHMNAMLEILDYENLDRIWIERVEETVRDDRQKVEQTVFDLHIVRTTENGAAYEDTIDHLSESEREVTGLIFALAGYLVHDLHETVPYMLLDSLEAIDSDRIAQLVDYFEDYADYLVVALLHEDAQALDESVNRVTAI
ncbi:archaea-specific SMC-related protein [Haloarcula marina]|uniref:archaea-specific SMC-related protein n=1 Tax=Haloarcula marina TaxID=2961574 RepID=UPI0020B71BE5|nr:archaea-specific SMC-related protein [Halomicroarcula marina]